jgi:hypothetical protein
MDIKAIVQKMTLEEKAGLCSGADFWHTKAVERLGIPSVRVTDGPHGLRKQEAQNDHLGLSESVKAICFPAGCALASSFDRNLIKKRSFAYYETRIPGWYTGNGEYEIFVGTSSRDLPLRNKVKINSTERIPLKITDTTTIGDVLRYGKQPELLESFLEKMRKAFSQSSEAVNSEMFHQMIDGMPLHSMVSFFSEDMEDFIKTLQ